MPLYARALLSTAAYLLLAGAIYWLTGSEEYLGAVLILTTASALAYVGIYLRRAVRVADREPDAPAVGLPHVGPTIWPFVFSVAAGIVAAGALAAQWLLGFGVAILVVAGIGWVFDIRHQRQAAGHH